jgi:multiple sugar transport system substrate-binding protein
MPTGTESAQYGGDAFDAGMAAMTTMGHWAVPQYTQRGFRYDVAPFPSGPEGRVTSVNSAGFVIPAKAAHPDQTWEFIKYVLSPEGQTQAVKLGLAVPAVKSIAESDTYLVQPDFPINQKVFTDAFAYAHMKPVFKGYDAWNSVVANDFVQVWENGANLSTTLDQIKTEADAVLAENK